MMANGTDFPVSAEQYIAGLDITACVRESMDRRHVRLILAPFIKGEGADGASADQIESLLALAGVEVTDWDRAFIRQCAATRPNARLFSDPRRRETAEDRRAIERDAIGAWRERESREPDSSQPAGTAPDLRPDRHG